MSRSACRNRWLSLFAVTAYCAVSILWLPDAEERGAFHYRVVLTLGYGHLLGAAVSGSGRGILALGFSSFPSTNHWARVLVRAALVIGLLLAASLLFLAYRQALTLWPGLAGLLLAIATWHTVENDLSLGGLYANGLSTRPSSSASIASTTSSKTLSADRLWASWGIGALVLALITDTLTPTDLLAGPPTRFLGFPAIAGVSLSNDPALGLRIFCALVGTGLVCARTTRFRIVTGALLVSGSALDLRFLSPPIAFADAFALATLYHLVSWLVISVDKISLPRTPTLFALELTTIHMIPVGVLAAILLLPTQRAVPLEAAFFSPSNYLFWSVAHVLQTWLIRK